MVSTVQLVKKVQLDQQENSDQPDLQVTQENATEDFQALQVYQA